MEVGLIFKIAAVGILVTILSQVLKHSGREEHAFLLSLAALILVPTRLTGCLSPLALALYALTLLFAFLQYLPASSEQ